MVSVVTRATIIAEIDGAPRTIKRIYIERGNNKKKARRERRRETTPMIYRPLNARSGRRNREQV